MFFNSYRIKYKYPRSDLLNDDPIVDHFTKRYSENPNLEHNITNYGGHLGFIQHGPSGIHWMEDTLCSWFKSLLNIE